MILTLKSLQDCVHIDISVDQFKRLRDPSIHSNEIEEIAAGCGCDPTMLKEYVEDLKKSIRETIEIDASCEYSDHL